MLPILELKTSPKKSSKKSDTHISTPNTTKEEVQDFASILNTLAQPASKKSPKSQSNSTKHNARISSKQATQFLKSLDNQYNLTQDFKFQHSTPLKSAKDLLEFSTQKQGKTLRDLSKITENLQLNLKTISIQTQTQSNKTARISFDSKMQSPLHNPPKRNLAFNPTLEESTQFSKSKTTIKKENPTKSIKTLPFSHPAPPKKKEFQNPKELKDLKDLKDLQTFKEPQTQKKDFPASAQKKPILKMETKLPKIESKTQTMQHTQTINRVEKVEKIEDIEAMPTTQHSKQIFKKAAQHTQAIKEVKHTHKEPTPTPKATQATQAQTTQAQTMQAQTMQAQAMQATQHKHSKETKAIEIGQQTSIIQNNKEESQQTNKTTQFQITQNPSKPQTKAETKIQTAVKTQPKAGIKNQPQIKSDANKQTNTTDKHSLSNPQKSPINQQNTARQAPINTFNASQKEQILQSNLEQTTKEEIFLDNLLKAHSKQHIPSKEPLRDKEIQKEGERLQWENHSSNLQSLREMRPNIQSTFTHFSDRLREAIANYRPPITKISLELNPQNLGSVELTIAKNGDKLSVQISSNQNALQLIMQNAQDFKNALGNLGFQNIEMDFKDNQGNLLENGNFNDSNGNQQGNFQQGQQNAQNFKQNPQQNPQNTQNWNENSLHIYKEAHNPYARVALVDVSFSYEA